MPIRSRQGRRGRPHRVLWVLLWSLGACALAAEATAGEGLLRDPGFDAYGGADSPWEVRYGSKASEPSARPRWRPARAEEAERGAFLSIRQTGPAAGTLLIGQRVTLPPRIGTAALSVRYQTFCPLDNRSGLLRFEVFSVGVWDRLSADPEKPTPPVQGDIHSALIKSSGDDVTAWALAVHDTPELRRALETALGQPLVLAVAWTTWHPTAEEWAKLDDLQLGEPPPVLAAKAWPGYAFRNEPLRLGVTASGPGEKRIRLAVESAALGRRALEMVPGPDGVFAAELPGPFLVDTVRVQASWDTGALLLQTPWKEIAMTERPTHPSLFYTPTILDRMRRKLDEHDWARGAFEKVRAQAEDWLERPVDPPPQGGGWSHDYTCPQCGGRLKYRESHPHDHLCTRCDRAWQGPKLDAVWRSSLHGSYVSAAASLALTHQINGDPRYGRRAVEILLWYADHYAGFPINTGPAGRGKVQAQSLSECTWLLRVMEAADLAYGVMTPEEARHIETDLIRAGAEHTHNYTFGIHNIQCWHNTCYAAAGYFLGDRAMVEEARNGKLGFVNQVERGILEDGLWFERSLGYHNYTLSAIIAHCEAARNHGDDLYRLGRVPGMFTAPLRLAFPDLSAPSLNDMGYSRSPIGTTALELAAAWYDDPHARAALAKRLRDGAGRDHIMAWKYGEALPEAGEYTPPPSEDLPGAGLAVLRQGQGKDAVCAMLEYGEHGGGHGHPDKLQLILYALGMPVCPDIGTTGYGNPMHGKWYKTTPGHNTVTIGGASMARVSGRLLNFRADSPFPAAAAAADSVYPEWDLTRRLLLGNGFLLDVFDVAGPAAETVDWFLRAPGELSLGPATRPLDEEPLSAPYAYLDGLAGGTADDSWQASWTLDGESGRVLRLDLGGTPGTQVAQASAPGPAGSRWHTLRVRRRTARTRFAAVYQFLPAGADALPVLFGDGQVTVGALRFRIPEEREALPHPIP